ncbi:MAG: SPOR domain-containing protein [Roseiarcus sp.]
MSGSPGRIVPEINLDEFERRLRSAGAAQDGAEDPLAELTRLVDMISRDDSKASAAAQAPRAPAPKGQRFPAGAGAPVAHVGSGRIKAWNDSAGRDGPMAPPSLDAASGQSDAGEGLDLSREERAALLEAAMEAQAETRRSRSWRFKTAALAALGLALLGGAAALKHGVAGLPKSPPFIAAAEGPSKIQPPSDATVQSGADTAALLMKDSTTSAPVKVVSTEEQPVDLRAQTPSPEPTPVASAAADASSPVAPAANTPIVAPADSTATIAPLFPEAKPVKTVSVRPDGTLISVDSTPAPAPPAQPATRGIDNLQAQTDAAAAGEPATPKVDLPTKLSPKSSARVVAKTDTTAPADATDTTPTAPLQLGAPVRPSKVAKAPPAKAPAVVAADDSADAPPADVTEPAAASGDWAVQFAAPRSEADAKSAIARLKNKYADALGDTEIGVRKADVKGEAIYRVRANGLSKAEAAALCAKFKASGGDCFIAKN